MASPSLVRVRIGLGLDGLPSDTRRHWVWFTRQLFNSNDTAGSAALDVRAICTLYLSAILVLTAVDPSPRPFRSAARTPCRSVAVITQLLRVAGRGFY